MDVTSAFSVPFFAEDAEVQRGRGARSGPRPLAARHGHRHARDAAVVSEGRGAQARLRESPFAPQFSYGDDD